MTTYKPGIDGPSLTISEGFDPYYGGFYWWVRRGRGESCTLQSWIYGTRRAESLARKLYRAGLDSGEWETEYRKMPED